MSEPETSWTTCSASETEEAGAAFARGLTGGTVVALYGGLGMGKTAFVRGMAVGLGLSCRGVEPHFCLGT